MDTGDLLKFDLVWFGQAPPTPLGLGRLSPPPTRGAVSHERGTPVQDMDQTTERIQKAMDRTADPCRPMLPRADQCGARDLHALKGRCLS